MNFSFENKLVIVTGASSGIGKEIAIQISRMGGEPALIGRNATRLEEVAALCENRCTTISCDLTQEESLTAAVKSLSDNGKKVSGIVHCAGVHSLRPLKMTKSDSMASMFNANVISGANLTREIIGKKLLDVAGSSIVFMSSAAALRGEAATAAYAASKGAIISLTKALAVELAPQLIRINCLVPGVVETPLSAAFLKMLSPEQVNKIEQKHPLGFGKPNDVAHAAIFLLSEYSRWITGQAIPVDGGYSAC
jgi:NAD(P)-dependent dehydrogenase (short-subunit alcohol dehydrogenase family)